MKFHEFFPVWDKLTATQQDSVRQVIRYHKVEKGYHVHDSSADCLGLIMIKSGQLRAFILSEDGREITIGRLLSGDTSLLSASCVMPDLQLNLMIEAEKDSEFYSIPACLFKNLADESLPVSIYCRNLLGTSATITIIAVKVISPVEKYSAICSAICLLNSATLFPS